MYQDFEEIKTAPLQEKARVLMGFLERDPKRALLLSREWELHTTPEDMVNRYLRALALKAIGVKEKVQLEVTRLIVLSAGLSNVDGFGFESQKVWLPKNFFDTFPEYKDFGERFWADQELLLRERQPAFTLDGTGKNDLAKRTLFGKTEEVFDYWPPRLNFGLEEDNRIEHEFDRVTIANTVIDTILHKRPLRKGKRLNRTEAQVVTFGSCFALNLSKALSEKGIRSESLRIEEAINTTFANKLLLQSILNGVIAEELSQLLGDMDLSALRKMMFDASAIVLTVGVSPVNEWVKTGKLCLAERYKPLFESGEIRQRFTSVEENKDNIVDIVRLLRQHNEKAQIYLTLSPVPLTAVADGSSVFERDVISKSTLRLAIDQAAREVDFTYWPSFEIVKWVSPHIPVKTNYQAYAEDDKNSRHVSRWIVDVIVDRFIEQVFEA